MTGVTFPISIKRGAAFDTASEWQNKAFVSFAKKLIKDSDGVCDCCGFKSHSYARVQLLPNGNPKNPADWQVCCAMCYESQRYSYALEAGLGEAIWLPELTQSELNMIVHGILNILLLDEEAKAAERDDYEALKREAMMHVSNLQERGTALLRHLSLNQPSDLVRFLQMFSDTDYSRRDIYFKNVRYLPNIDKYLVRAKKWFADAYKGIEPKRWKPGLLAAHPDLFKAYSNLDLSAESDSMPEEFWV